MYLVKTDVNGNEEWSKTYGGGSNDWAFSIFQTNDGGYVLGGATTSFASGIRDMYLVKIDVNGNEEWFNTFGEAESESASSILQTNDGGYLLGGYTSSFRDDGNYDYYLVKTDVNGNEEWSKTFGGEGYDIINSILQTNDGGYLLGGYTSSFGNSSQMYIIKIDSEGNRIF